MAKTCEHCTALRAEIDSARAEADAILQDRTERVREGEFPRTRGPLFIDAKKRWDAAGWKFADHRASHFSRVAEAKIHRTLPVRETVGGRP